MSLVLTQVYLEPVQKKALSAQARKLGRKPSEAMRDAVDAYVAGVTVDDLKLLDAATRQADRDLREMVQVLDAGQKRATKFFAEMARLKKASA